MHCCHILLLIFLDGYIYIDLTYLYLEHARMAVGVDNLAGRVEEKVAAVFYNIHTSFKIRTHSELLAKRRQKTVGLT